LHLKRGHKGHRLGDECKVVQALVGRLQAAAEDQACNLRHVHGHDDTSNAPRFHSKRWNNAQMLQMCGFSRTQPACTCVSPRRSLVTAAASCDNTASKDELWARWEGTEVAVAPREALAGPAPPAALATAEPCVSKAGVHACPHLTLQLGRIQISLGPQGLEHRFD
jgi:hypothetical protein